MICIFATGFIGEKPELVYVGSNQKRKCEFDVVSERPVRQGDGWGKTWERATFVAWDEEAEKIASTLEKGYTVTCTGNQETSRYADDAGAARKAVRYRLTSWRIESRRGATEATVQSTPAKAGDASRKPARPPGEGSLSGSSHTLEM